MTLSGSRYPAGGVAAGDPAGVRGRGVAIGPRRAAGPRWRRLRDGQLSDDARLVVALTRTAAAHGVRVLTGADVSAVDGAEVHVDIDGSEALTLRAGVVVNAAGVWAQRLAPSVRLVPSRGSHLVVPAERLGSPRPRSPCRCPGRGRATCSRCRSRAG